MHLRSTTIAIAMSIASAIVIQGSMSAAYASDAALPLPGQHPQTPHFDGTLGGGPEVHRSTPVPGPADAGPPAHIDNEAGGGPNPHRPGPLPRQTELGPAAHLDNEAGSSPTPHQPGRGPNLGG